MPGKGIHKPIGALRTHANRLRRAAAAEWPAIPTPHIQGPGGGRVVSGLHTCHRVLQHGKRLVATSKGLCGLNAVLRAELVADPRLHTTTHCVCTYAAAPLIEPLLARSGGLGGVRHTVGQP